MMNLKLERALSHTHAYTQTSPNAFRRICLAELGLMVFPRFGGRKRRTDCCLRDEPIIDVAGDIEMSNSAGETFSLSIFE
jgi:hypothetical protein